MKSEPVQVVEEVADEEEEEEYSDEEETEVKQVVQTKVESVRRRQIRDSPKPPSRTLTPRRSARTEIVKPPVQNDTNDVAKEEPKKVAPVPQTSIVTTRSSTVTTRTERKTDAPAEPKQPQKRAFSIKVQLAILVIVAVVIFFVITKMEPAYRNPFKQIMDKAKGKGE